MAQSYAPVAHSALLDYPPLSTLSEIVTSQFPLQHAMFQGLKSAIRLQYFLHLAQTIEIELRTCCRLRGR